MRDSKQMRAAVTQYARNYIEQRRKAKRTFQEIGAELGCSSAYVQHLNDPAGHPKMRVGIDVEQSLANIAHGGKVDALRDFALHLYGGDPVIIEVKGETVTMQPEHDRGAPQLPGAAARSRRRLRKADSVG